MATRRPAGASGSTPHAPRRRTSSPGRRRRSSAYPPVAPKLDRWLCCSPIAGPRLELGGRDPRFPGVLLLRKAGCMSEAETLFAVLRQSADAEATAAIEHLVRDGADRDLCRLNVL